VAGPHQECGPSPRPVDDELITIYDPV